MDQFIERAEVGLNITAVQWDEMCQQAERLAPEEVCGLLAGKGADVLAVYPVTNALHHPLRFRMEPAEQLKAFLEIEQNELEMLAIYHSHPEGPAYPSTTDIQEAYYPESIYLILFRVADGWQCKGFTIRQGEIREVKIHVGNDLMA